MNNIIFFSNSCVGLFVSRKINYGPNNNPFIGTLIPNDLDYLKLINNLEYYLTFIPKLGEPNNNSLFSKQNDCIWYKHSDIKTPYPVIYIGDIEVHCIHECFNKKENYLTKFIDRFERMKTLINSGNYKIICLLSFSEFFNDHDDLFEIINLYFDCNNTLNIEKYFIGPSKFNNNHKNYIDVTKWDNLDFERNESHVYSFNDQPFSIDLFVKNIQL